MGFIILQGRKQNLTSQTSINTQVFLVCPKNHHQVVAAVLPRSLPCFSPANLSHRGVGGEQMWRLTKLAEVFWLTSVGLLVWDGCCCFACALLPCCKVSSISLVCWLGHCQKVM